MTIPAEIEEALELTEPGHHSGYGYEFKLLCVLAAAYRELREKVKELETSRVDLSNKDIIDIDAMYQPKIAELESELHRLREPKVLHGDKPDPDMVAAEMEIKRPEAAIETLKREKS